MPGDRHGMHYHGDHGNEKRTHPRPLPGGEHYRPPFEALARYTMAPVNNPDY